MYIKFLFLDKFNLVLEFTNYYFKRLMNSIARVNLPLEVGITNYFSPLFSPRVVQHPVVWSIMLMQLNFSRRFRALPLFSNSYSLRFEHSLNILKLFKNLFCCVVSPDEMQYLTTLLLFS